MGHRLARLTAFYFNAKAALPPGRVLARPRVGVLNGTAPSQHPAGLRGRGCSGREAQDALQSPWATGWCMLLPCDKVQGRTRVASPPSGTQFPLRPL